MILRNEFNMKSKNKKAPLVLQATNQNSRNNNDYL